MVEDIPCYSAPAVHWDLLPVTRLASRKKLIEQNIKKRTGPALCVLCDLKGVSHEIFRALFLTCMDRSRSVQEPLTVFNFFC
jgi:hypothetical protein